MYQNDNVFKASQGVLHPVPAGRAVLGPDGGPLRLTCDKIKKFMKSKFYFFTAAALSTTRQTATQDARGRGPMTVPMHAAADMRRSGGRATPRRQPLPSC